MTNDLPAGWQRLTIPALVGPDGVFSDGDWVESKDQNPEGAVRLIQLADIGDGLWLDKSHRFLTREAAERLGCTFLREGDVLVARMPDPLGRACIFPGDAKPCVTAVDVCIIRAGEDEFTNRWLEAFINSPQFRGRIAALQKGTTRKRISRKNLGTIPLNVPPRDVQDRISAKIDELFSDLGAGVAALGRATVNLKRYRAAVLKAAVEGKLTEEWRKEHPDVEPASEFLKRILAERRQKWEEEQLEKYEAKGRKPSKDWKAKYQSPQVEPAEVCLRQPHGWLRLRIGLVCDTKTGGTPRRDRADYYGGEIPWVKSGELGDGRVFESEERITTRGLHESSAKIFPKGTLCIALYGATVGKIGVLEINAATNQAICGIMESPFVVTDYLFLVLWSLRAQLIAQGQGGAQPNISNEVVRDTMIPIPPVAEQHQIVAEVAQRMSLIQAASSGIEVSQARARRLRAAILRSAFSGKLVIETGVVRGGA